MSSAIQAYMEEQGIDGNPTPEQAAHMLNLAMQGDTGEQPETDVTPAVEQKQDDAESKEVEQKQAEPEPVLLAKDGKHTIPYEELTNARTAAQEAQRQAAEAKAMADALAAQKAELEQRLAEAAQQKQAEQAPQPLPVDEYKAQLRELRKAEAEAMMDGDAEKVVDLREKMDELMERQTAARQPVQQPAQPQPKVEQPQGESPHFSAIRAAHPDFESIAESKELKDWIAGQVEAVPAIAKPAVQAEFSRILERGTAADVIGLLSQYKAGAAQKATSTEAAAAAAVANAKSRTPASLSEIPGAAPAADPFAALDSATGVDLVGKLASMSPAQIEAYLNRKG